MAWTLCGLKVDKYFTICPFWTCFQDQTVLWLCHWVRRASWNWMISSWISWLTIMALSTSAPLRAGACSAVVVPALRGLFLWTECGFSFSDYFVSHYSNILWLIAFGCAFPSSLFLLKVHCVCKNLSGFGLWHRGFSEVAQITLWGGTVLPLVPLAEKGFHQGGSQCPFWFVCH